ncbi:MAG: MurT ligase domain-containing protein [Candidatus Daviesbacteria bacterium]
MSIKTLAAIILGKLILKTTQVLNFGGGSAAPGYYALKIDPDLVKKLIPQIPQTIVITGTNGKTTTARMLAHFAQNSGLKVLRNATGSNLERGIASTLIFSVHLPGGRIKNYDLAIWELDEAAFNTVVPKIRPEMIVFLNVFRDQLDRYGEIDTVVSKWCQTLEKLDPKTQIFINGDDGNLLKLTGSFRGKIQTFGLKDYQIQGEKIIHKAERQKPDLEAKNITFQGLESLKFTIGSNSFTLPVPGVYHIYNFLAALSGAKFLNIPIQKIQESLKNYSPAFGRVEKIQLDGQTAYIFLIKNPAGATLVFQTLKDEIKPEDHLLLALNDNFADGKDVSWIWDSQFEQLQVSCSKLKVICSGVRAADLALRLKYAGFDPRYLIIQTDLQKALRQAREGLKGRLFILPTYTALLKLQAILASMGVKGHYWKEDQI